MSSSPECRVRNIELQSKDLPAPQRKCSTSRFQSEFSKFIHVHRTEIGCKVPPSRRACVAYWWEVLHPDLCSTGQRCVFVSDLGSSKSCLRASISEFTLGDKAALGIVEGYLNTYSEKSNMRVRAETLDITSSNLLILFFFFTFSIPD